MHSNEFRILVCVAGGSPHCNHRYGVGGGRCNFFFTFLHFGPETASRNRHWMGLISTGLGELNGYFLLQRCRVPSKVSPYATRVFVVAFTTPSASSGHFLQFLREGREVLDVVLTIVIFTVQGEILGGQIGSRVASRIPQHTLERGLGVLFILVAALTLVEFYFKSGSSSGRTTVPARGLYTGRSESGRLSICCRGTVPLK